MANQLDWRVLKRYLGNQGTKDFSIFMDNLPQNVGQTALIAAAFIWIVAAALGLYTMVEAQKLIEKKKQLEEAQALKPPVPKIVYTAIEDAAINNFIERAAPLYPGIKMSGTNGEIIVSADSTGLYSRFREAVIHAYTGGENWQVSLTRLCVGRECGKSHLLAQLSVQKVRIEEDKS